MEMISSCFFTRARVRGAGEKARRKGIYLMIYYAVCNKFLGGVENWWSPVCFRVAKPTVTT